MTVQLTIIDQQFTSGNALLAYLQSQQQVTFYNEAENNFRKTILLSCASYFEKEISDTVIEFAKSQTDNNDLIVSLIRRKAVSRQYHTYFDWEKATNANSFFALFGDDFKAKMNKLVKDDTQLDQSIKAFLEIGQERNKMVHQNFAEISIDKTAAEIYTLYKLALYFISTVKKQLIKIPEENIIGDKDNPDRENVSLSDSEIDAKASNTTDGNQHVGESNVPPPRLETNFFSISFWTQILKKSLRGMKFRFSLFSTSLDMCF